MKNKNNLEIEARKQFSKDFGNSLAMNLLLNAYDKLPEEEEKPCYWCASLFGDCAEGYILGGKA